MTKAKKLLVNPTANKVSKTTSRKNALLLLINRLQTTKKRAKGRSLTLKKELSLQMVFAKTIAAKLKTTIPEVLETCKVPKNTIGSLRLVWEAT